MAPPNLASTAMPGHLSPASRVRRALAQVSLVCCCAKNLRFQPRRETLVLEGGIRRFPVQEARRSIAGECRFSNVPDSNRLQPAVPRGRAWPAELVLQTAEVGRQLHLG